MGINEIRNRRLAPTDIAKINAMAEISEPEAGTEDDGHRPAPMLSELESPVHLELKKESPEVPAVNDVAFYGPRVNEFYRYFLDGNAPGIAVQMALAACTLKASVVIGQAITDTFGTVLPGIGETPAIPVKAENPVIPAGTIPAVAKKKRGRPFKVKK